MSNLYDVLEVCLREVNNGADIDSVLFRYPEFAEELRPILEASVRAKSIASPDPSPDVVRRNRARVLQQAAQMREARAHSSRRMWSVPLRRLLVSLAVIVALFVSSTGLVRAASTTLPGDNLYPVKRTWEDLLVLFTLNIQSRQALEVEHENERLEELYELFAEGRSAKVDFAGIVTRQSGDLWLVSKVPVVISPETDLRDQPVAVGDAVRIRGITQPDGTVRAERVDILMEGTPLPEVEDDSNDEEHELPENGNENDEDHSGSGSGNENSNTGEPEPPEDDSDRDISSREGVVDSINGSILVVNGRTMNIASAEVRGTLHVGASVRVEGYFDASGIFIVTRVEVRDGGSSGGGNSNSDDSDSDDNNDNSNDDDDNSNEESGRDDNNNDDNDDDSNNSNDDDNSGSGDDD